MVSRTPPGGAACLSARQLGCAVKPRIRPSFCSVRDVAQTGMPRLVGAASWQFEEMQGNIVDCKWRNAEMQGNIVDCKWRNAEKQGNIGNCKWRNAEMQGDIRGQVGEGTFRLTEVSRPVPGCCP